MYSCSCVHTHNSRAKASNINCSHLWAVTGDLFLCGFLVFPNLSQMYMCYFHYLKQILFFKRKTKKWSSSSYFVVPFDKKVSPNSPRAGTDGYFHGTNCANSKHYSQHWCLDPKSHFPSFMGHTP